jgi:uncharacterized protein (DUF427 family)
MSGSGFCFRDHQSYPEWDPLAGSSNTVIAEGRQYFPPDSIRRDHLVLSGEHTGRAWEGEPSYYELLVGDTVNRVAAWCYRDLSPAAAGIRDRAGFWQDVPVEEVPDRP